MARLKLDLKIENMTLLRMQEVAKALPDEVSEKDWLWVIVQDTFSLVWRFMWGDRDDRPTTDEILERIGTVVLKLIEIRKGESS